MGDRESFVRHAISAPEFDHDKAHRSRLIDDLHQHLQRRLILIAAPAGYGKTTFLADFSQHSDIPIAWVRLTEADRDPSRLARLVWASLTRRFHRLKNELQLEEHSGSTPKALADLVSGAVRARVPEDFVLLLDDVHLVNQSEGSLDFVNNLVQSQPENMTTIVSGREIPDIPLVPLIAKDALKSYGAEDLALDLEELQAILRLRLRRQVSEDQALKLLEETGGWVTGLLLSDLLAGERHPSLAAEPHSLTYEYLASAVFERQPGDVKEFLLKSAPLPVMTAHACDAALGREDSGRQLTEITRKGLFISVTGDRPRTYEYHHLFRAFLLAHPDQDEETIREIRLAAAEYFAESDDPETAFDLYMEAGALGRARDLADDNVSDLYESGFDETIRAWTADLLSAGGAGIRLLRRCAQIESQRGRLDRARQLVDEGLKIAERSGVPKHRFAILITAMDIFRKTGATEAWESALNEAGELVAQLDVDAVFGYRIHRCEFLYEWEGRTQDALQEIRSCLALPKDMVRPGNLVFGLSQHGVILGALGDLHGAEQQFRRALEVVEDRDARRRRPVAFNNLGFLEFMKGNYSAAVAYLSRGQAVAWQLDNPADIHITQLSLGEIMADLGLYEQARVHLECALRVETRSEDNNWLPYTTAKLSMVHRRANRLDRADELWTMWDPHKGSRMWRGLARLEQQAVHALDDPDVFQASTEELVDVESPYVRVQRSILLAWAHLRAGEETEGLSHLSSALNEAKIHELGQIVAGEAKAYPQLRNAVIQLRERHPRAVDDVLQRVERMENFVRARDEDYDTRDLVVSDHSVRALGQASISIAGDPATEQIRPLHQEVFFYILDSREVARDELLSIFWPDLPKPQQFGNLYSAIHSIRQVVGSETIVRTNIGYRIGADESIDYDTRRFESSARLALKLRHKAPETLMVCREAMDTFKGSFLPGFDSEWVLIRRRELDELFILLVERYTRLVSENYPHLDVLRPLKRAIEIDPYRESLHLLYLEALAALGRYHEIRIQTQRYRRRLAEDLQLRPSDEFERRYKELVERRRASHILRSAAS